ncbi:guanine nucleotide-binding protein G(I)/G(S)/G(O) subunit gamma-2 [Budorcas taxicolor]|uniref:guanine nucleotide-binding protein G(I)/G(S)/G(O) subunit gamma-2 n=1 Tax=Budorcas taxicolor TaxID=37181 RepID=UPI002284EC3C|nr:guanine nucleotide-binding protein G(I)/G(S)/G(O) subunit gamma-2 [Budorcas taxicolor]
MIEDKAGWGLVPGLQALLLHIHTTAAAQWAAPTTAGLGWAGCAGARLHSAARRAEESHSPRTSLGSQASEPQALGSEEVFPGGSDSKESTCNTGDLDSISGLGGSPGEGNAVSKAAADLMAYCEAHAKEDPLLTPVPASENPFREKKFFCAIL